MNYINRKLHFIHTTMIAEVFTGFIRKYPHFFVINCMLMLLVPINEVFMSRLYGRLFDAIQKNVFTMNHFNVILATIVFLQIGFAFSDYFNSKQMTRFQEFCKKRFVKTVFEKFEKDKEEPNPHDVLSKILRTQHILADWYGKIFGYIVPISIQLIITVGYLFFIDKPLASYIFVMILIFAFFLKNTTNTCNEHNNDMDQSLTTLHNDMGDILVNYISVYKEQTLPHEMKKLTYHFKDYQKFHNNTIKCTIKYRLILSTTIIIFVSMFVRRCYFLLKNKLIKNAVFYSVFMILANMISNIVYMIDMHRDMIFDWGLIKNSGLEKSISDISLITHKCDKTKPLDNEAVLEIVNLTYRYRGKAHNTLNKINLKVNAGERIAITGHIGSGKSTLMKLILKMLYPTEGSIYLKKTCIYDIGTKEYFKRVGFMPQNCTLFKRSIMENILYDNRSVRKEHVMEVIQKYDLMKHFKNGMDVSTDSLSGGQRQLVWFLRIYFKNPELIILDEPTASLDKATKDLFIHLMDTLLKEKTIVIITHDSYLLQFIERVEPMDSLNQTNP